VTSNAWRRDHPLVVAHRGHRAAYPEQTLPAFVAAIELGCRAIEADLQLTRDGRLVMMHDLTVDRTTDGHGAVADATLAELEALDAGSWFGPSFAGTRIPTVEVLLDLAIPAGVTLCLEVKGTPVAAPDVAVALVELLRDRGLLDRVFMSSFDHAAMAAARRIAPEVLLAPERLPEHAAPDPADAVRQARTSGATVLQHRWEYLTPEVVDALHAAGVAVWTWPTDTLESIEVSVRCGADGVIGDDVAWLLETVPTVGGPAGDAFGRSVPDAVHG
jgi:glycerophosphoryl diester phosphodiesterase